MPKRDIDLLVQPVARRCKDLIRLAEEELGLTVIVSMTLRTPEEHAAFYAQGRESYDEVNRLREIAGLYLFEALEENDKKITWTKETIHFFECAFDVYIKNKDNGLAEWARTVDLNDNDIPDYEEVGLLGERLGLTWGGRFKSKDLVHFQYTGGLSKDALREGYRPVDNEPEKKTG